MKTGEAARILKSCDFSKISWLSDLTPGPGCGNGQRWAGQASVAHPRAAGARWGQTSPGMLPCRAAAMRVQRDPGSSPGCRRGCQASGAGDCCDSGQGKPVCRAREGGKQERASIVRLCLYPAPSSPASPAHGGRPTVRWRWRGGCGDSRYADLPLRHPPTKL